MLTNLGPKFYSKSPTNYNISSNTNLQLIVPFLIFTFGIISICTAFVKSFSGLCVARAFLGLAEGGTMPVSFLCLRKITVTNFLGHRIFLELLL